MQAPNVNETWKDQGGIYIGVVRDPATNQRWHLILAEAAITPAAWGPYGKEIANANSYHDGEANTRAMLESEHDHPTLKEIVSLNIDDHQDFYLPAQRELNLICINAPDRCEPVFHWSSTQYSAYSAWVQDFEYGNQFIDGKDNERSARAVRRILIIE